MADMTFFDGFSFTWASEGPVAKLSQEAYKVGWNFVGNTPPAVEQFNAVHSMDGQRQRWLFGQIKAVTDQAGLPLSAAATDTLWLSIKQKLDLKQDGLGFTPVQQGGGAGQGGNKVHIGWSGGTLTAQVDANSLGSFVFAGRQITAGAGLTGGGTLDGDRVISMGTPSTISSSSSNAAGGASHTHELSATGVNAGAYGTKSQIPRVTFDSKGRATSAGTEKVSVADVQDVLPVGNGGTGGTNGPEARAHLGMASMLRLAAASLQENGYARLQTDDGQQQLIIQWGRYIPSSGMNEGPGPTVAFPTPFPNACFSVVCMERIGSANAGIDAFVQLLGVPSATQFQTYIQKPGDASANWSGMFWLAIGN